MPSDRIDPSCKEDGLLPLRSEGRVCIFLVRHGRTVLNADGRLRGRMDPDLDDVGRAQASAAAVALGPFRHARVVSSPLLRARNTATAIASTVEPPRGVEVDERLVDRDYGPWTGHRARDLRLRWGSIEKLEGVEPLQLVEARAWDSLDAIGAELRDHSRHAGSRAVVVVSHEVVNRLLLGTAASEPGPTSVLRQRTGCINVLELTRDRWVTRVVDWRPGEPLVWRIRELDRKLDDGVPVGLRCSALVSRAGRVLLCRRRSDAAWVLPGGSPRRGESAAACARREVAEETGLQIRPRGVAFVLEAAPASEDAQALEVVFLSDESDRACEPRQRELDLEPHFVPLQDLGSIALRPPLGEHIRRLLGDRVTEEIGARPSWGIAPYLDGLWQPGSGAGGTGEDG